MSTPARLLVLWCPDWSIEAALADEHTDCDPQTPLALAAHGDIHSASVSARTAGVRVGQRVRDAQVTCPTLQVVAHSPERDQRLWDQVLVSLSDTLARVSVVEPGMLCATARGLARFYGSETQAAQLVCDRVANGALPLHARVGVADSLFAATHAAQHGTSAAQPICVVEPGADADFLGPLPVRFFDDSDLVSLLERLGIATFADFAALPADQVRERFGRDMEILHAGVSGADPRRVQPVDIPPGTDVVWRSDELVTRTDALSFAIKDSAESFLQGLLRHHLVCTAVRIAITDDSNQTWSRDWRHPRYFTASDLVHRVRWQWESLARVDAEEYYDGGVTAVSFQALHPDAVGSHEPGLWGRSDSHQRVEHAVAQLQSRVGHQAITRPVLGHGHDFAERESTLPWGVDEPVPTTRTDDETPPWPGQIPPPLPATVFHPPHRVRVCDRSGQVLHVDDQGDAVSGEPAVLCAGERSRQVVSWAGPWPVLERWWDRSASRARARLQLVDGDGIGCLVSHDPVSHVWELEASYD